MSFEYYDGSVFECADIKKVDMIVNTVNCKGFMGTGLALEFKLRYPRMFQEYQKKCTDKQIKIGQLDLFAATHVKILNFPTKDDWKHPSKMTWIVKGLQQFVEQHSSYCIQTVAFPKLGTNNGGLHWGEVKKQMEKHFDKIPDLKIYICLDSAEPKGLEGSMLTIANSLTDERLKKIGLNTRAIENYMGQLPFKRFFLISKVQGIGSKLYEKLHNYCYQHALKQQEEGTEEKDHEQLSIFFS